MKIRDIAAAVAERLGMTGVNVVAAEVDEGFEKPAFFVDVFPVSMERMNEMYQMVALTVEAAYFPDVETNEKCVEMADALRELFAGALRVKDRRLTVNELNFETENTVLRMSFDLEFMDDAPGAGSRDGDCALMENLNMGGIAYHGNARDTNNISSKLFG